MNYKSIVIGASSGIGLAITKELLNTGHLVTGISRRSISLENKNYTHIIQDVTSKDFISLINKNIQLSNYNNLIYCTGKNKVKLAAELKKNDIEDLFNTNLIPALLISSEFAKSRKISKDSSILYIGSIWSSFGLKGRSLYGASKSALIGFTKHLSAELSPKGCLVNVLSPGFTNTPLTEKTKNDKEIKNVLSRVNSQDLLDPKDIASHAMMLITPNNKCITGQEIFTDGGFTSHA